MSNGNPTERSDTTRSFEERVFLRFDALDARMGRMEARIEAVEGELQDVGTRLEKLEAKAYDTKPIWEQALTEISEVKHNLIEVKQIVRKIELKVGTINDDMSEVRGTLRDHEGRLQQLNG